MTEGGKSGDYSYYSVLAPTYTTTVPDPVRSRRAVLCILRSSCCALCVDVVPIASGPGAPYPVSGCVFEHYDNWGGYCTYVPGIHTILTCQDKLV